MSDTGILHEPPQLKAGMVYRYLGDNNWFVDIDPHIQRVEFERHLETFEALFSKVEDIEEWVDDIQHKLNKNEIF